VHAILRKVPQEIQNRFREIGFGKWGNEWFPVLELSPLDLLELSSGIRQRWVERYKNAIIKPTTQEINQTKRKKKTNTVMRKKLVYWYGVSFKNVDEAFSLLRSEHVISYEDGVKKGYHILSTYDALRKRGLEQVESDLVLSKENRIGWMFPNLKKDVYFERIRKTACEKNNQRHLVGIKKGASDFENDNTSLAMEKIPNIVSTAASNHNIMRNMPRPNHCSGVFRHSKSCWSAKISYNKKLHNLGSFGTRQEAVVAFEEGLFLICGRRLNAPTCETECTGPLVRRTSEDKDISTNKGIENKNNENLCGDLSRIQTPQPEQGSVDNKSHQKQQHENETGCQDAKDATHSIVCRRSPQRNICQGSLELLKTSNTSRPNESFGDEMENDYIGKDVPDRSPIHTIDPLNMQINAQQEKDDTVATISLTDIDKSTAVNESDEGESSEDVERYQTRLYSPQRPHISLGDTQLHQRRRDSHKGQKREDLIHSRVRPPKICEFSCTGVNGNILFDSNKTDEKSELDIKVHSVGIINKKPYHSLSSSRQHKEEKEDNNMNFAQDGHTPHRTVSHWQCKQENSNLSRNELDTEGIDRPTKDEMICRHKYQRCPGNGAQRPGHKKWSFASYLESCKLQSAGTSGAKNVVESLQWTCTYCRELFDSEQEFNMHKSFAILTNGCDMLS